MNISKSKKMSLTKSTKKQLEKHAVPHTAIRGIGTVYKIELPNEEIYIGSTMKNRYVMKNEERIELSGRAGYNRLQWHFYDGSRSSVAKRCQELNYKKDDIKNSNLEKIDDISLVDLLKREMYWCEQFPKDKLLNKIRVNVPIITEDGKTKKDMTNQEYKKARHAREKENVGEERLKELQKIRNQRYQESLNKDPEKAMKQKQKARERRNKNKEIFREKKKQYYEDNKESILKQQKQKRDTNKVEYNKRRREKAMILTKCDVCNQEMTKGVWNQHKKTKKHLTAVAALP